MFRSKTYVKTVLLMLMLIFSGAYLYVYLYSYSYPLPILSRVSLDAKMKFIKENINTNRVDTIIVGSSIGLNNVHGSTLEESSKRCESVLNLSGFELRPEQIEQLLELSPVFTNLKRVIYSAQFSDFSEAEKLSDYDVELLKRYITNRETLIDKVSILLHSFSNLISCVTRQWSWNSKHQSNNKFTYLGFDHTGSVPLHIYGEDIIQSRWETPHGKHQDLNNDIVLQRMVKKAEDAGVNFYFILQPNRREMVEKFKDVRETLNFFEGRTKRVMKKYNGSFLNLHHELNLSDQYFADRTHLNDKGSILISKVIAKFIDNSE